MISRSSDKPTVVGPSDWFTGAVYIDQVATPQAPARAGAALVHFTPGARTAWHTHPLGQTIHVIEGICRCQREGAQIETLLPGDSTYFEPGENHWHGASAERLMVHIAVHEHDASGSAVAWGRHVSDAEYAGE
ncbi:MAG: cupin protein [Thermoleophilia bacterium]|nr:cupin protein [Thermoleophilia bacterium]